MLAKIILCGLKKAVSAKGKPYADLYWFGLGSDGSPEMEQQHFRTFDEGVIAKAELMKAGTEAVIELQVRDAFVTGLEVAEDEEIEL